MKAVDYRNETWAQVRGRLVGSRMAVLELWRRYGPCTTAELARRSGRAVLTIRPRTTELLELGFVALASDERGPEGRYMAVAEGTAEATFRRRAAERRKAEQMTLL